MAFSNPRTHIEAKNKLLRGLKQAPRNLLLSLWTKWKKSDMDNLDLTTLVYSYWTKFSIWCTSILHHTVVQGDKLQPADYPTPFHRLIHQHSPTKQHWLAPTIPQPLCLQMETTPKSAPVDQQNQRNHLNRSILDYISHLATTEQICSRQR
jgi:hypothetical protein